MIQMLSGFTGMPAASVFDIQTRYDLYEGYLKAGTLKDLLHNPATVLMCVCCRRAG